MKARKVLFPGEYPKLYESVDVCPKWGDAGEVPVHEVAYPEGELRFFGTGTAVADVRELPITVRMPFIVARGHMVWSVATSKRREMSMALRKIVQAAGEAAPAGPGLADAAAWPHLLEYLTVAKYPDGSAREVSSLIILADGTGWRGCLSDKDNGRTMWKTAITVEGLLLALEAAVAEDDPSQWRQSAAAKWKGKKKS